MVRMRGLPVRVMCTSEMYRRWRALLAILGAVARTTVGREAMVAGGCGIPRWAVSQSIDVGDAELRSSIQAIETPPAGSKLRPTLSAGGAGLANERQAIPQGQQRALTTNKVRTVS